jgi:rod shape-determining protein MreD
MISRPSIGTPGTNLIRDSRVSVTAVAVLALATLGLQALLPIIQPALSVLNLPLLTAIYVVLTLRAVVPAMLFAMLIGWAQDGLTRDPVGMLGIVYSILGYLAATASLYFKVNLPLVLGLFVAGAYLLHEILLFLVRLYLLGQDPQLELVLWGALTALHAGLALLAYPLLYRRLVGNP